MMFDRERHEQERHLKGYLIRRQRGLCHYCQDPFSETIAKRAPTIDHLTPRCRGGRLSPENAVMASWECNQLKGPLTVDEFVAALLADGIDGARRARDRKSNMLSKAAERGRQLRGETDGNLGEVQDAPRREISGDAP